MTEPTPPHTPDAPDAAPVDHAPNEPAHQDSNLSGTPTDVALETDPEPDNAPDPEADATAEDELVVQTDNAPTETDGPQDGVDQDPVEESDVVVEEENDGPAAS